MSIHVYVWTYMCMCHTHHPTLLLNRFEDATSKHNLSDLVVPWYIFRIYKQKLLSILKTIKPWAGPRVPFFSRLSHLTCRRYQASICLVLKIFSLHLYLDHNWRLGTNIKCSSHFMNSLTCPHAVPWESVYVIKNVTDEICGLYEQSGFGVLAGRLRLTGIRGVRPWSQVSYVKMLINLYALTWASSIKGRISETIRLGRFKEHFI